MSRKNKKIKKHNVISKPLGLIPKGDGRVSSDPCAQTPTFSGENDVYEKNIQVLRKHHPHVETLLDERAPFGMEVRLSSSGVPNLLITKAHGEVIPLYRDEDMATESASLRKDIKHLKGKVLCVMGAGLFIHAGSILDMVGNLNLVVFFEAFPALFKAALMAYDLTTVLSHPNVRLAIGDSADPYGIINDERDRLFTNDFGEFLEYGRVVSLAPEWYKTKKVLFDQFLKRRKISKDTVAFSGKSFLENSFKNLLALTESRPIHDLHDCFKGIPAIVVASGPSLSKNIHHLKTIDGTALIIAADSALAPLMAEGITPHMIASVDNNDFTFEKLAPFIDILSDVDLVYIPNVTSKIVNGIRFKSKYYAFPDGSIQTLFNRILGREGKVLEDIHSVIHLALATAQVAGCDPIIFMGLDLAFSGARDHVDGTILHWGNNKGKSPSDVMVESIHGDMITSSNGFIGMIEICQRMIQTVPDRTYIDATEGGAKIGGTKILALASAMEHHCLQCTDFSEIKRPLSAQIAPNAILHELKKLNHDLGQVLEKIARYMTEQERVDSYLANQPAGIDPGSLPNKIIRSVQVMDRINIQLENEQTVLFVKSIILEGHDRYKELEVEAMESRSSVGHRFSAALTQQAFVQSLRKAGLEFLSKQFVQAMSWIDMIIDLENRKNFPDHIMVEKIEQLIRQGYLTLAETMVENINQQPEKDYFLGCIALKNAQIEKGKAFFLKARDKDENLSSKIQVFKESIVNEWLKQNQFQAVRNIAIDLVLELEPGHPGAIQLKQELLLQRARELIVNGRGEIALNELQNEYNRFHFDDSELLATLSFLLLDKGKAEDGLNILKQFITKDYDNQDKISLIQTHFKKMFDGSCSLKDFPWMEYLVGYAGRELWAKRALQEFFWSHVGDRPWKIIWKQISSFELDEIGKYLEAWKDIKDLLPDWYYLESHRLLALQKFNSAELTLKQAISTETDTIHFKGKKGGLYYSLCLFALYMGEEEKAVSIIKDVIFRFSDILFSFTACLLFIRNNEESLAEDILKEIVHKNDETSWLKYVVEFCQKPDLIRVVKQYNSFLFLSVYYYIFGKSCMMGESSVLGALFFRAAVNHDSTILNRDDGLWLCDIIQKKWEEETSEVEHCLKKGQINQAKKIVDEWTDTRCALNNFHRVKAVIIEVENGVEKAIEYLQERLKDESDNPDVYIYMTTLLFDTGRRDEAQQTLESAVKLNHHASTLWEDMGDVLFQEGEFDEAVRFYEKCFSAQPQKIDVLRKIGDSYRAKGNLDSAIMAYRAVIEKDNTNERARMSLEELLG
ncbi:MAG: DUF115 domain-containing protein [Proteobacteria bacterium]|nr:DUF115 domain-containing protein [Pseudomonadota bacterium]